MIFDVSGMDIVVKVVHGSGLQMQRSPEEERPRMADVACYE